MNDINYERALSILKDNFDDEFITAEALDALRQHGYSETEAINIIFTLRDLELLRIFDKHEYANIGLGSHWVLTLADRE